VVSDMNNILEALNCPNCGAIIDYIPSNTSDFQCKYCGGVIHINREPQSINVNIADVFLHVAPDQIIQRIGRLFYLGKYEQAKLFLEKALVYHPSNAKLSRFPPESLHKENSYGRILLVSKRSSAV